MRVNNFFQEANPGLKLYGGVEIGHLQHKLWIMWNKWQGRRRTCKVTLRRVRITAVAVEKQYHIFWMCVCSLSYPESKAHAPYYSVICGLSCCKYFFHISQKRHDFRRRKKVNIKNAFWFSQQVLSETFLILKRIRRCRRVVRKVKNVLPCTDIYWQQERNRICRFYHTPSPTSPHSHLGHWGTCRTVTPVYLFPPRTRRSPGYSTSVPQHAVGHHHP